MLNFSYLILVIRFIIYWKRLKNLRQNFNLLFLKRIILNGIYEEFSCNWIILMESHRDISNRDEIPSEILRNNFNYYKKSFNKKIFNNDENVLGCKEIPRGISRNFSRYWFLKYLEVGLNFYFCKNPSK